MRTLSGKFSPFPCSPSSVGSITKHASRRSLSISGVVESSKLLMISTVRDWTSYRANLQPMQVLTPPANVNLMYISIQKVPCVLRRRSIVQITINAKRRSLLFVCIFSKPSFGVENMCIIAKHFLVSSTAKGWHWEPYTSVPKENTDLL